MPQKDMCLMRLSIADACCQRAAVIAETLSGMIDVAQYFVLAESPQQLFGFVAGQAMCTFIPVLNTPLPVHEVDTIADVIQQLPIEGWIARHNRVLWIFWFDRASRATSVHYPIMDGNSQNLLEPSAESPAHSNNCTC
jgi:hypothetical protein